MNNIIFVCYDQGTGGEHLAVEISKLNQCNDLYYNVINGRYVTIDIVIGKLRYLDFNYKEINDMINQHPSSKWHVIPTHFTPDELYNVDAKKIFVIIRTPTDEQHQRVIDQKVLEYKFSNPLQIKGQIEADGYEPIKILKGQNGPISYNKLLCLYANLPVTNENLEKCANEYKVINRKYKFNKPYAKHIEVEYLDTKKVNFYQQFTKLLSNQLT